MQSITETTGNMSTMTKYADPMALVQEATNKLYKAIGTPDGTILFTTWPSDIQLMIIERVLDQIWSEDEKKSIVFTEIVIVANHRNMLMRNSRPMIATVSKRFCAQVEKIYLAKKVVLELGSGFKVLINPDLDTVKVRSIVAEWGDVPWLTLPMVVKNPSVFTRLKSVSLGYEDLLYHKSTCWVLKNMTMMHSHGLKEVNIEYPMKWYDDKNHLQIRCLSMHGQMVPVIEESDEMGGDLIGDAAVDEVKRRLDSWGYTPQTRWLNRVLHTLDMLGVAKPGWTPETVFPQSLRVMVKVVPGRSRD